MSGRGQILSTCRTCGFVVDHRIYEIEWELLERCPECDAYYWTPEPVKIPAPLTPASAPAEKETR
jgi:hypothetical protein